MTVKVLKSGAKTVVGVKQTLRVINNEQAKKVFVAVDADEHVTAPIIAACISRKVAWEEVSSMQELGQACGIHVKAATAAVLKN